mmetsp:Transcript_5326/g.17487  ORF Transcript_5326/g.17487 Transcript_5326/m.17487 type:complete len:215 (-) Transcript_5326:1892-2536(-)
MRDRRRRLFAAAREAWSPGSSLARTSRMITTPSSAAAWSLRAPGCKTTFAASCAVSATPATSPSWPRRRSSNNRGLRSWTPPPSFPRALAHREASRRSFGDEVMAFTRASRTPACSKTTAASSIARTSTSSARSPRPPSWPVVVVARASISVATLRDVARVTRFAVDVGPTATSFFVSSATAEISPRFVVVVVARSRTRPIIFRIPASIKASTQ